MAGAYKLNLLSGSLLTGYKTFIDFDPVPLLKQIQAEQLPVDFFDFYKAVSSVYSSKIEGEEIDFDSFYKSKFLKVPYNKNYTQKAEDLYRTYTFTLQHRLTEKNMCTAHAIASMHLLSENNRGRYRTNLMYVLNKEDRIEYVAAPAERINEDMKKLFLDIARLTESELSPVEVFYFAAYMHLVFVKIHPFQDGNGRMGRLLEKWFMTEKLGTEIISLALEKNYYRRRKDYYANLKALGVEYVTLDYQRSLNFLLMSIQGLKQQATGPDA